jgi:hypothetical protein
VAARALVRLSEPVVRTLARRRDRRQGTFGRAPAAGLALRPLMMPAPAARCAATAPDLERLLAHELDLLGSGPVDVSVPVGQPPGWTLVDGANRERSARIAGLISPGYHAIDWQPDPRSGHRWSARTWYRDVRRTTPPGAEPKWPRELARMQHLPRLALGAAHHADSGVAVRCRQEVRDQTLDLIASNPPRWGMNWAVPMDVGIRVANLLLAQDLLAGAGLEPDDAFGEVLAAVVRDHARRLLAGVRAGAGFGGNHHLGTVCGLLWASAHLPADTETDAWLGLAIDETLRAARRQFLGDGANFEASTGYHRLAGEMVVFAVALMAGLPSLRLDRLGPHPPRVPPPWCGELLAGIARFSGAIRTPDGGSLQVGDHDSGRFFKLAPCWRRAADGTLDEDHLDQSHLRHAIAAMVEARDLPVPPATDVDAAVTAALSGGWTWRALPPPLTRTEPEAAVARAAASAGTGLTHRQLYRLAPPAGGPLVDRLGLLAFPEFGLWVWRSTRLWLALRCGSIGKDGHAHYDQLAIELWFDGAPLIRDPGTGCYRPDPAVRDAFRAPAAHWVPRAADAPGVPAGTPMFGLPGARPGRMLAVSRTGFAGEAVGAGGERVLRRLQITADAVVVEDAGDRPLARLPLHSPHDRWSPGYGIILPMPPPGTA